MTAWQRVLVYFGLRPAEPAVEAAPSLGRSLLGNLISALVGGAGFGLLTWALDDGAPVRSGLLFGALMPLFLVGAALVRGRRRRA